MSFKQLATPYSTEPVFDKSDKKQARKAGQRVVVTSPDVTQVTFDAEYLQLETRVFFSQNVRVYRLADIVNVVVNEDETGAGTLIGVQRAKTANLWITGHGWSEHVKAKSNLEKVKLSEVGNKLASMIPDKPYGAGQDML